MSLAGVYLEITQDKETQISKGANDCTSYELCDLIRMKAWTAREHHEIPSVRREKLVELAALAVLEIDRIDREDQPLPKNDVCCDTPSLSDGPRVPARWGTHPTQVCSNCARWRCGPEPYGPWHNEPIENAMNDELD